MTKAQHTTTGRRAAKCNKYFTLFFVVISILGILYLFTRNRRLWNEHGSCINQTNPLARCNLFSGKWVYDNKSYPLYKENHCFYQFDGVACEKGGRRDIKYQNWRWQPHQCDLPRFNATTMLEKLRNKRLLFVGDAIGRNQWASLLCLLEYSIPPALRSVHPDGSLATFNITEYNASIEHFWAPFLVESSSNDPVLYHFSKEHTVKVHTVEKHAKYWMDADILIFNSYNWWKRLNLKILKSSDEDSEEEVGMLQGYEVALKTWLNWLDNHINRRTRLYFVSMSPTHERGDKWRKDTSGNCYGEDEPYFEEGYLGSETDLLMMRKVEDALSELRQRGLDIQLLNITELSRYRKDGHTSIYKKQWKRITKKQLENPQNYADCESWCIPGVPDIWNEILFTYLHYF